MGGGPEDLARDLAERLPVRTAVLLEGASDMAAVDALAARHGRDRATEGICVLPMGGATNVGRFAGLLGPSGLDLRLTGLRDARERGYHVRALGRAHASPHDLFACTADLEDEPIRALGEERVTELIEAEGDLRPLRTFLRRPAQRDRTARQRLGRFLGTKKGRKIQCGGVLVEAMDPARTPAPSRVCWRGSDLGGRPPTVHTCPEVVFGMLE